MKYVIAGASTFGVDNMGDDAMLACLVQGIKREDQNAKIIFLARHPDQHYDDLFGFKSIKNLDHDSNEAAINRIFLGFNKGDLEDNLVNIKKHLEEADILIIGGNSFMEVSENNFLRGISSYATTLAILAKFCGTPFALFGLNIVDKLNNSLTIEHAKFLCENAIAVTVRETSVVSYLKGMGVRVDNVVVSGDPAFGMKANNDVTHAHSILEKCNINLKINKKVLTIAYRREYWNEDYEVFDKTITSLANLIDTISSKYQYQMLFIPNCTYTSGNKWEDDRAVSRLIKSKLKSSENVFLIESRLNVFETYCLFSLTDIHISNRRHSNTFSAMNGKPFIAMSVSLGTHISAFLESLDVSELSINLNDPFDDLIKHIDYVILNANSISKKLLDNSNHLKVDAQNHVPIIISELKKKIT
jgi:polysaccharide pyruvyl transferase WcaK-like protein